MGEVVDVASAAQSTMLVRGTYPTNREMISRLIKGLTSEGRLARTIYRLKETLSIAGLDAMSRAECIRTTEDHLRVNGIIVPTPRSRAVGEEMLSLAAKGKYTDATIEVTGPDGRTRYTFHANTCVLITSSTHFKKALGFGATPSSVEGASHFRIEMMEPIVFALILRFMYTGTIGPFYPSIKVQPGSTLDVRMLHLEPAVLASLVLAADMYVVAGLVRECMDFIDPSNALVVMKSAARVDTEETNMLVEACASVLVHSVDHWWSAAHEEDAELPPRAVYAIAAQMMSGIHRMSTETGALAICTVWEAVRAWYGGASLLAAQAALIEEGTPAGMLIAPYTESFYLPLDATGAGTGTTITTHTTVFGSRYDVQLKDDVTGRRVIEVRAHDSDISASSFMVHLVASSPKLVTVSTGAGARGGALAHAVLGCDHGCIVLAVDADVASMRVTVELDPIFSLITAAAALDLNRHTAELVQGLHPAVLHCILRSTSTSCDPMRALRALAPPMGPDRADAIVCALTDKLEHASMDALLDVLNDVPSLGRIDSFSRLLVSRIVSEPDVSADVRETALVGLIKCISAARMAQAAAEAARDTDQHRIAQITQPTDGEMGDEPEPEPESKFARLA